MSKCLCCLPVISVSSKPLILQCYSNILTPSLGSSQLPSFMSCIVYITVWSDSVYFLRFPLWIVSTRDLKYQYCSSLIPRHSIICWEKRLFLAVIIPVNFGSQSGLLWRFYFHSCWKLGVNTKYWEWRRWVLETISSLCFLHNSCSSYLGGKRKTITRKQGAGKNLSHPPICVDKMSTHCTSVSVLLC